MAKGPRWWLRSTVTPYPSGESTGCWEPAADVYRTRTGWLVKFDLAGVRHTDDVQIERRGNTLRLVGQRRDSTVHHGLASYSLEICYNRFERRVRLPTDIESAKIRTEYDQGMLLVWIDTSAG